VLSVITGAYNVAEFLPGCIESVLSQTMSDLELMIVDDGSTDETPRIIAEYAARDPRVRAFRGPNRGVSHARNVGMRHARGRYFAILDSDDEWEPEFAATLTGVLDRQPEFALVTGNGRNVGGGVLDGQPVLPWPSEPREIVFLDMVEHVDSMFIMTMFRREVYETLGGFNESLFRSEDYEYWLRAAAAGFRLVTCPQPLARYRRRPNSASADESAMIESITAVLRLARGFRARARAAELAAIDRQIERLSAALLLTKGKSVLLRRDFVEARTRFRELYGRGAGVQYGLLAAGLSVAPQAVLKLYQARLARLRASSGEPRRWVPAPAAAAVEGASPRT
jgi:glycosyltransferase involved in cell wall biosynthesis